MITRKQFLISVCFFSVKCNIFFTHHFVKKTFWRFFKKLGQIFVKALSGLIFINDKFFHYNSAPTDRLPGSYV